LAPVHSPDGILQSPRAGVLQQVAVGPGPDGRDHLLRPAEAGEHEDADRRTLGPQPADGLDAVDARHHQVGEQHVRPGLLDQPDRGGAVAGLADHREPLGLQERPQTLADDGVVVGDDDPDRRLAVGSGSHWCALRPHQ
jgi:hypothetical protein